MANNPLPHGITAIKKLNQGLPDLSDQWYDFDTVTTDLAVGTMVSFVLDTGAKTFHADGTTVVDATTAADTAASSGAKICGIVSALMGRDGRPFQIQAALAGTSGRCQVHPAENWIYACRSGASMTQSGFAKLAPGAIAYNTVDLADEDVPSPYTDDTLGTQHATNAQAFQLLGAYASVRNQTTSTAQYTTFKIASTHLF